MIGQQGKQKVKRHLVGCSVSFLLLVTAAAIYFIIKSPETVTWPIIIAVIACIAGLIQALAAAIDIMKKWFGLPEETIPRWFKSQFQKRWSQLKELFQHFWPTVFIIHHSSNDSRSAAEFMAETLKARVRCKVHLYPWNKQDDFLTVTKLQAAKEAVLILFTLSTNFIEDLDTHRRWRDELHSWAGRAFSRKRDNKGMVVFISPCKDQQKLEESLVSFTLYGRDDQARDKLVNMISSDILRPKADFQPAEVLDPAVKQDQGAETVSAEGTKQSVSSATASPPSLPSYIWLVPYKENPDFVPRVARNSDNEIVPGSMVLKYILAGFSGGRERGLRQVIWGMNGVGKTELALQYAYEYGQYESDRSDKLYRIVLWLEASPDAFQNASHPLDEGCKMLNDQLRTKGYMNASSPAKDGLVMPSESSDSSFVPPPPSVIIPDEKILLRNWLEVLEEKLRGNEFWLLIIDKCEKKDFPILNTILPAQTAKGDVLVTMYERPDYGIPGLRIDPIEKKEEGASLLARLSKKPLLSEEDKKAAEDISAELGGLPLAIKYAAACITGSVNKAISYREYFEKLREEEQGRGKQEKEEHVWPPYAKPVGTAFNVALKEIKNRDPDAYELLLRCALLAPDPIPENIIRQLLYKMGRLSSGSKTIVFLDPVKLLDSFLFLVRTDDEGNEKTRVLQRFVRNLINRVKYREYDEHIKEKYTRDIVDAVTNALPQSGSSAWDAFPLYLPHIKTCLEYIEKFKIATLETVRLLYTTACYLKDHGYHETIYGMTAEKLLLQALRMRWKLQGNDYPDRATCLNALAEHRYEQYLYIGTDWRRTQKRRFYIERTYKRALDLIRARTYEIAGRQVQVTSDNTFPEDQDVQTASAAQEVQVKADTIIAGQSATAATTAQSIVQQHTTTPAVTMMTATPQQSGSATSGASTPRNVEEATVLNNLGRLYDDFGDYGQARDQFKEALEKREQPRTVEEKLNRVVSLNNSAVVSMEMVEGDSNVEERFKETEKELQDALQILGELKRESEKMQTFPGQAQTGTQPDQTSSEQAASREIQVVARQAPASLAEMYEGQCKACLATLYTYWYTHQGKAEHYYSAKAAYEEALEVAKNVINARSDGEPPSEADYIHLVARLNNLAELHRVYGQRKRNRKDREREEQEALSLYEEAIRYWWEKTSKSHPLVLAVLDNFEELLKGTNIKRVQDDTSFYVELTKSIRNRFSLNK